MSSECTDTPSNARTHSPPLIHAHAHSPLTHHRRLHELHLESIKANAKRANDRVKEGVARKLRLEAAKVEKASAALERVKYRAESVVDTSSAKRDANKAKREALFEAVREARKTRQTERVARQIALGALEDKACSARAKMVMATSQKGRAAVKHALAVSAALKAKEQQVQGTATPSFAGTVYGR